MIDNTYIASPLLTHVMDEADCFSNSSPEYAELLSRLLIIHTHLKATESAIRVIEQMAVGRGNKAHALQRIYQIASDYSGAAESAEQMLDDVNACLEYLHWDQPSHTPPGAASDDELDELLGDRTNNTHQGTLKAQTVKEEN
ncbi:hypothetical protein [Ferribacterium limneticum]|uniref:hypothetical protein n=1 Tax=Ferribacterium limneticum TaxID=76259 RepID=UPI001CF822B1|nr:hypothetical protein [Ferribacterium limneticum]UCV23822.1 hypothetical protein KI613_04610 [Ferribacterium limneticum]